jgi:sugar lactone lactonase YvrE
MAQPQKIFKQMKKIIIRLSAILGILLISLAIFLRVNYGGGEFYPDLSTEPILPASELEEVFRYDEPFGNIAVSVTNQVYFTVHPESRPSTNKVMTIKNGKAVPYPNQTYQSEEFNTVLGLFIDASNRLWTIDHGNHGFQNVTLLAFDLNTDKEVYRHIFKSEIGEKLSFFNDLQVSPDGRYVYIADVSFFGKNPAIVILDTQTGIARRLLEDHPSVTAQDWIPKNKTKTMTFFGGLVALKPGIDGIVIDQSGEWIYYGTMTHDGLFKVKTEDLINESLSKEQLAEKVIRVGTKPLSDGLSIDTLNNVYITDVDNGSIARLSPNGELRTLIQDRDRIRWADGASYGGNGYLYFTDSAIPDQMLQSKSHIKSKAPYYIYRVNPGIGGIPGH